MATKEDFETLAEMLDIEVKLIKPIHKGGPLMMGGRLRDSGLQIWIATSKAMVVPATKQKSARLDESLEGAEHFFASLRPKGCYAEFVEQAALANKRFCWLLEV